MSRRIVIIVCLVLVNSSLYSQQHSIISIGNTLVYYDSLCASNYIEKVKPLFINYFDSLSSINKLDSVISQSAMIINRREKPDANNEEEWNNKLVYALTIRDMFLAIKLKESIDEVEKRAVNSSNTEGQ